MKKLGPTIQNKAWKESARLLREEMAVRREITPDALIPVTERLIREAEKAGCGARFTGAGAGGSVWALGEKEEIDALRQTWQDSLASVKGAGILPCQVDLHGVR